MYQGVRKSKIYRPSGAVLLLRLDTDVKLLTDLKEVSFFFFFFEKSADAPCRFDQSSHAARKRRPENLEIPLKLKFG